MYRILIGDDSLLVGAVKMVAVLEIPNTILRGLVILEFSFIKGTVGKDPTSLHNFVLPPIACESHAGIVVGVGAATVFLAELPPT